VSFTLSSVPARLAVTFPASGRHPLDCTYHVRKGGQGDLTWAAGYALWPRWITRRQDGHTSIY